MTPRATYRFQFHSGFTFADAEALVPYLDELGISHAYASPITTAVRGSTHGYDVTDPTRINPELGGEDGFRRLVDALRGRGMGVVLDIVPNHMGVANGENAWWEDVLLRGEASEYARFFDIDWRERVVLPILGDPLPAVLEQRQLRLEERDGRFVLLLYGERVLPVQDEDQQGLSPTDEPAMLGPLLDRQHYRLAWWRAANDELNWRRFFTVNELAGLRAEDPAVFDATHALVLRLYAEGLIDGVRVDHVDGLTDPAGYCRALRERLDAARPDAAPAWLVVEKILGPGEEMPADWGVDGTSGYDFMEDAAALLHDPAGEEPLGHTWAEWSGRTPGFAREERRARRDMLAWAFEGQLARATEAFSALAASAPETAGLTAGMLRRALERMLWVFPVYRTYGTGTASPPGDARVRERVRRRAAPLAAPGEDGVTDRVLSWLEGTGPGDPALAADAVRRFQQLSAPIAAKSVEDTAFYRYNRLLSRTDVGFDPRRFSASADEFHAAMRGRAERFPHALLATATHDHKRGEDVRARLAVLSELPGEWAGEAARWRDLAAGAAEGVSPADLYALFQTLLGAWPEGQRADDAGGLAAYAERVVAWQRKALREAKLRSSWEAPDERYEGRCEAAARALLDPARSGPFLAALAAWAERIAAPARANSLVQAALRCTVPGVPDLYQGAEPADLSLVDPDNRRPVDYAERRALMAGDDPRGAKLRLIRDLLALRRADPAVFERGSYEPVAATGARAEHVLAFRRTLDGRGVLVVAALRCAGALAGTDLPSPAAEWWGDTAADGRPVAELLRRAPVSVTVL